MSSIPYNYGKYVDDSAKLKDQGTIGAGEQINSPSSAGSRGLAQTTQFTKDSTQMKMGQKEGMTPMAESMVEIRSILNRIDGVNVPVQELDLKDLKPKASDVITYGKGGSLKYIQIEYEILGTLENMLINNSEQEVLKRIADFVTDEVGEEHVDKAMEIIQKAKDNDDGEMTFDDMINQLKSKGESAVEEDLDYRSDDILNKAGFDPADIDTYMKVFNDHGDTSDIDQMNMKEKVGLADCMSMVLNSHGIQNESYQPMPEGDEFDIEEDEDFEEVLGPLGFPEDETELFDAEYQGRKVPLNKPMRGDVKKFKVYVKDPKTGNVKKVNFGHGGTSAKRPTMRIRKSNPKARKSFRARHNCANPGPKTKARYWSCRKW